MDALKTRLTDVVGQLSSQSPLTEAINYMLNHWNGLTLFLNDGAWRSTPIRSSVQCARLH
jgi:transposase